MTEPKDVILHVADLHFWSVVRNPFKLLNKRFLGNINVFLRRRHEFPMERAEPFADYLASRGVSNVVLTGDFTSTATDEEFTMARGFVHGLSRRGLTVTLMPGNHDVYTFEAQRAGRFERYFAEHLPVDGFPARLTLPGGTPLILVQTVCPNLLSSRGHITEGMVERTAALLRRCEGPVLVAGHYPVIRHTYGYHTSQGRSLRNAESLRKVLGESGKRVLYFAGHVHRFSYTRDPDYPALQHLANRRLLHSPPLQRLPGRIQRGPCP